MDLSVEHMEQGVADTTPWFDRSVVLVAKDEGIEAEVYLFGLFRPFTKGVWVLAWATVIVSGIVHQILEYWSNKQEDRSPWQWFMDSHYLSLLNATQNYEYAPNSASGRIFGVSMAMWSLVMTATYTANLASLLIKQRSTQLLVDTIEKVAALGVPICTHSNTNADIIIETEFEKVIRIPKATKLEAYEALQLRECGLLAGQLDGWLGYQVNNRYNSECDMTWVGREVDMVRSGFTTKTDVGNYCTSYIGDVFNLHLTEMSRDGFLEGVWEYHRAKAAEENLSECVGDGDLEALESNSGLFANRLLKRQHQQNLAAQARRPFQTSTTSYTSDSSSSTRRKLKGGGDAAASTVADGSTESLSVAQLSGAFVVHYCLMVAALLLGGVDMYYARFRRENPSKSAGNSTGDKRAQFSNIRQMMSYRPNGPIIGSPSPRQK
jgi:hypothetical protein